MHQTKISVGGDPEFFLFDDGYPCPAHEMVPGTKENPHKLKCGAVQVDGMAVEFNIDPSYSSEEFSHNINETLLEIRGMIPKKYEFRYQPSVFFRMLTLEKTPDHIKELGCSPDWNAYTSLQNISPMVELEKFPTLRSAGGHITAGWAKDLDKTDASHIADCEAYIKEIDPIYQSFSNLWDQDMIRHKLYGAPGAYRPTSFGAEYRTPSNAWVRYPKLYPFIFNMAYGVANQFLTQEPYVPEMNMDWIAETRRD